MFIVLSPFWQVNPTRAEIFLFILLFISVSPAQKECLAYSRQPTKYLSMNDLMNDWMKANAVERSDTVVLWRLGQKVTLLAPQVGSVDWSFVQYT